jgi:hypothetical protein
MRAKTARYMASANCRTPRHRGPNLNTVPEKVTGPLDHEKTKPETIGAYGIQTMKGFEDSYQLIGRDSDSGVVYLRFS